MQPASTTCSQQPPPAASSHHLQPAAASISTQQKKDHQKCPAPAASSRPQPQHLQPAATKCAQPKGSTKGPQKCPTKFYKTRFVENFWAKNQKQVSET